MYLLFLIKIKIIILTELGFSCWMGNSCISRPFICMAIIVIMPICDCFYLTCIFFISMAEPQRKGEQLPADVGTDDCLASYTHIYSPDLLK